MAKSCIFCGKELGLLESRQLLCGNVKQTVCPQCCELMCGLSQEELGAELKVSRQTISKWESCQSYPDFQRLVLLSDYFGLTLDELVKDVDVQEVREKNINSEKLDSIYSDVGKAKQFVKWYLIIAGSIGAAVLVLMVYFAINAILGW